MSPLIAPPATLIQDLVDANRILFHQGIVDAFGHVSARHPERADRYLMARNVAPDQVVAGDIVEYDIATGEAVAADPPRLYLERYIHSEIYKARPAVMAVVHNHSPAVLPFAIAKGARFRPVCHMCGFLGDAADAGAPLFEVRNTAGAGSDLLIRNRELGAALAAALGPANFVLMRGHGCTVVADSVRVAVYRAVYAEVNAKLLLQSLPLGEPEYLTAAEAEAARSTCEGQIDRPWNLWKQQVDEAAS